MPPLTNDINTFFSSFLLKSTIITSHSCIYDLNHFLVEYVTYINHLYHGDTKYN